MRVLAISSLAVVVVACNDQPPTASSSVNNPFQLTTVYTLEDDGTGGDYVARARYYDALGLFDIWGNVGSVALSGGDLAFVDSTPLDTETRLDVGGAKRVDYSHKIGRGKPSYVFELRRPNDEVYSATIPAPSQPLVVETKSDPVGTITAKWTPVPDANLIARATSDVCSTSVETPDGNRERDMGASTVRVRYTAGQQCTVELTIERRTKVSVAARWLKKGKEQLPSPGVWAETLAVSSTKVVMTKP